MALKKLTFIKFLEVKITFKSQLLMLFFTSQSLLRDFQFSINDILVGNEVKGIFDEWTWEGTGIFTLGLALPVLAKGTQVWRRRIAINKVWYLKTTLHYCVLEILLK